jgi:hypothetical protein
METAQFDTFAQSRANPPLSQARQESRRKAAGHPAQEIKKVGNLPVGEHIDGNTQFSPTTATGSAADFAHAVDEIKPNASRGAARGKISNHTTAPLRWDENSRKGALEQADSLSTAAGHSLVHKLASAPVPPVLVAKVTQSTEHIPFPPDQDTSKPSVVERSESIVHPFADMDPYSVTERLSSVSEEDIEADAIVDPLPIKESATENILEGKIDRIALRSASLNDGATKKQSNAAFNEGVSKPHASKTPAVMELPHSTNQKSKPDNDNEAVRIGVLEITVGSPPQPTKHAETDSTPNKLSWARGIARAHGLRQG